MSVAPIVRELGYACQVKLLVIGMCQVEPFINQESPDPETHKVLAHNISPDLISRGNRNLAKPPAGHPDNGQAADSVLAATIVAGNSSAITSDPQSAVSGTTLGDGEAEAEMGPQRHKTKQKIGRGHDSQKKFVKKKQ